MKEITIALTRNWLYGDVERTTAYLGAKQASRNDSAEVFDRLAAGEGDRELLDQYADEAFAALCERLKGIVRGVEIGAGLLSVTLEVSGSYDDSLTMVVENNFRRYMAACTTASWLRMSEPDKESRWREEADRKADEIVAALYYRRPPRRRVG